MGLMKPDFPGLLAPGRHRLDLQQLHDLAVKPYAEDERRHVLFHQLGQWIEKLRRLGIGGTLWLDGSFLTEKPGPGDIDCILWSPYWTDAAKASPEAQREVAALFDHDSARAMYGLDFYLETPTNDELFHREAYWSGVLGFCHDRTTAKGFAELQI